MSAERRTQFQNLSFRMPCGIRVDYKKQIEDSALPPPEEETAVSDASDAAACFRFKPYDGPAFHPGSGGILSGRNSLRDLLVLLNQMYNQCVT